MMEYQRSFGEDMHIVLGTMFMVIGLFVFINALLKSEFMLYKLLSYRARRRFGDKVHVYNIVIGILITILGLLFAFQVIALG